MQPLRRLILSTLLLWVLASAGCAASQTPLYSGVGSVAIVEEAPAILQTGKASWYGPRFHGRTTASGERFNKAALTAAHKSLPFNSIVEVRDIKTNAVVRVRINDRGPFIKGRVIDLSQAAAQALGITRKGVATIELRLIRG